MNKLKVKLVLIFSLVLALIYFPGCAHKEPTVIENANQEIWDLRINGDTQGRCTMVLRESKTEKGFYNVYGEFSGKIEDKIWGAGILNFTLNGKTRKDVFTCDLGGLVDMMDGDAAGSSFKVMGKAKGSLSESKGSGTWSVSHTHGIPGGEWHASRIR
ncbi:MAG: hypothetical protein JJE15_13340 [Desulfobacteraceae bacterium]|nr:hypothetical protein [Desulfobacteraceae bacterium]